MKITLKKSNGNCYCRHQDCKNKPEYIYGTHIKKGTTCARIVIPGVGVGFYCRDCIETILSDVKKILNPNLWSFL